MVKVKSSFVALASDSCLMRRKMGKRQVNSLFERITRLMPHYYSHKSTEKFGDITVTPREWYRKIRIKGYSPFVYKVNDTIEFELCVDKFDPQSNNAYHKISRVVQRTGDGSIKDIRVISTTKTKISGKASYTGDTKFFLISQSSLQPISQFDEPTAVELFFEDVRSLSSYVFGWTGIIVSVLLTSICAIATTILLAMVTIDKIDWHIWMPEWITRWLIN